MMSRDVAFGFAGEGSRADVGRREGPALVESLEHRQLLSVAPVGLTLINATTDKTIGALSEGLTINKASVGHALSVQATPMAASSSVVFTLDGRRFQVENTAPFAIRGNNGSDYFAWDPAVGSHTLVVTGYSAASGTGTVTASGTVHFKVIDSNPQPPPQNNGFPTQIAWRTGAPSPIVRAEAVGGAVGNKLYVLGGFNNQGSEFTHIPLQSRCDYYDPATNTWHRLRDFPEPFTHSEEVIVGNDLWFVGGYVGNHPGPGYTHVWIYHTANDTWARGPDLPQPRGAGAAALVGNTIYFAGGMDRTRTIDENTVYALDLTNQGAGWEQRADLPNGRNHVAAASLNGFFYVIGGQHGQEDQQVAQNEVDRYDPATDTWTKVASLPGGRSHIAESTFAYKGRIMVIGGETGSGQPQRSIFTYNPATNSWSTLGLLPAARSTVVSGFINGKLVVSTGNGPAATTNTWIGTLS